MRKTASLIAATTLLLGGLSAQSALATSVSPGGTGTVGTLTDLGNFAAGSYQITGSGIVSLTGSTDFLMNPDGTPVSGVTHPNYLYFNPTGSVIADGVYGAAGSTVNIGALIGTFSATPSSPSDWFLIGYSKVVTLLSAGNIYASVNDTWHQNNTGAFDATVSVVPVPAAVWLLGSSLLALVGLGRQVRRLK